MLTRDPTQLKRHFNFMHSMHADTHKQKKLTFISSFKCFSLHGKKSTDFIVKNMDNDNQNDDDDNDGDDDDVTAIPVWITYRHTTCTSINSI